MESDGGRERIQSAAAEEEVLKRRNTDCVYFLASPLTCKKVDFPCFGYGSFFYKDAMFSIGAVNACLGLLRLLIGSLSTSRKLLRCGMNVGVLLLIRFYPLVEIIQASLSLQN